MVLQAKHTHTGFVAQPPHKLIYKIYVIIPLRVCAGGVGYTLAPPLIIWVRRVNGGWKTLEREENQDGFGVPV